MPNFSPCSGYTASSAVPTGDFLGLLQLLIVAQMASPATSLLRYCPGVQMTLCLPVAACASGFATPPFTCIAANMQAEGV